jgi:hypothetical protein
MARIYRAASYLLRRGASWYFRYRLPAEIQSVARRAELRLSLYTGELAVARIRLGQLLPFVIALKRLGQHMPELTPEIAKQVLDEAFTRVIEALEQSQEPWRQPEAPAALPPQMHSVPIEGFETLTRAPGEHRRRFVKAQIAANEYTTWVAPVTRALNGRDVDADIQSPAFRRLCLDLGKLEAMYLEVQRSRAEGDDQRAESFIRYYEAQGYQRLQQTNSGAHIHALWAEYADEKANARPSPDWSANTATLQQATFDEFLEISGDLPIESVSRALMRQYVDTIARLPKNRQKRYPNISIQDLLARELDASELPSARTVKEKLIRIGTFLRWCKSEKGLNVEDSTLGIRVKAESQSYSPFTTDDLRKLFQSTAYLEGGASNGVAVLDSANRAIYGRAAGRDCTAAVERPQQA